MRRAESGFQIGNRNRACSVTGAPPPPAKNMGGVFCGICSVSWISPLRVLVLGGDGLFTGPGGPPLPAVGAVAEVHPQAKGGCNVGATMTSGARAAMPGWPAHEPAAAVGYVGRVGYAPTRPRASWRKTAFQPRFTPQSGEILALGCPRTGFDRAGAVLTRGENCGFLPTTRCGVLPCGDS